MMMLRSWILSPWYAWMSKPAKMIIKPTPEQVRALRLSMGWAQSDMARMLHLNSPTMISRYERGRRTMHPAFWELVCIKATDLRYNVNQRHQEIERHRVSRVYVSNLIKRAKK